MDRTNKLLNYLENKTNCDVYSLSEDQNLLESGLLDSLQLIELIVWLEEETQRPVELDKLIEGDRITLKSVTSYLSVIE